MSHPSPAQVRALEAAGPERVLNIWAVLSRHVLALGLLAVAVSVGGCAAAGGGGAGRASDGDSTPDGTEPPEDNAALREIEEADIVKLQGGYFYLANRYRGLRIIDATAIERPVLAGGVDLQGRGVELFVVDDRAFVVTSADFFACAGEPVSFDDEALADAFLRPDYDGSRITVADVTDPDNPFEITHFDMDGFITATRRVGDIIYAAGNLDGSVSDSDDDVDTGGLPDPGDDDVPAPVTGPAAVVDQDGTATATATSTEGVHVEFAVTGAEPGAFVQLTVADRDIHADSPGIRDGDVLPLTVTVESDMADGEFTAELTVEFDPSLLDDLELALALTAVYRQDDDLGLWLAAALTDAGASAPTGTLGEYGFFSVASDDACDTNGDCGTDGYCNLPTCAAEAGECAIRPTDGCPEIFAPVCGCDGQTYSNSCEAAQAGVSVDFEGECVDGPPDDGDPPDTEVGVNFVVWAVVDQLGDYTVGRSFDRELTVTLAASSGGTVIVDPVADPYDYGEVITLTAVADDGFRFAGWSFEPSRPDVAGSEVVEVTLVEDLQVAAEFEADVDQSGPRVFVVSIDISDPANIRQVDSVTIAGDSLDIHVTPEAIYVLGDDPTMPDTTRVIYVDISDPAGDVAQRDTFRVPGLLENRFFVDEYLGTFRVVTEDRSQNPFDPVVALYTYDVGDPDQVTRVGRLVIETGESLRSVRFDGTRGYAVTFRQIDPLFVLDLADPAAPIVAGQLEVPGWSTHLVPLGERLVGIGFDDQFGFRPAVALYDVSRPERPRQLSRIRLGEAWTFDTTSEATVDEQALKVLEDQQLILVPVSSFDRERAEFVDSLQLIDLLPGRLDERGMVEHRGLVRRAGVADTRLWVLSDEALQVADMDDRDDVASLATVDIMSEQELLDAGLVDCVDSARFNGFELGDFGLSLGDDVIFIEGPFRGPCGAVGLIGMGLTAALMLSLAVVRRRWP